MYLLLVLLNIILAISLFSWKRQIREIIKQISEGKKLRISLSDKQIEQLAGIINEKNDLEQKIKIQMMQEKEQQKKIRIIRYARVRGNTLVYGPPAERPASRGK